MIYLKQLKKWRKYNMVKVWTNGCFDILHRGHIELFRYAHSLGDELIVGVDSDEKVKNDKSDDRPINSLQDRMFMLQSIKYIDKVIPFDSTKELDDTLKWYKPDIMVIGSDWKGKKVIGEFWTKKLVFFDRIDGYSTTKILEG
tara:strand:- start:277 stop:705 length:429 start_codon:yes stop_codon:yes gene_type:complete